MRLTRKTLIAFLVAAGMMLILACTDFTSVTWPWRHAWRCEYFRYAHASGWGYRYVSDYDLGQVVCYLGAYGLACVTLSIAAGRYRVHLAGFTLLLCLVGALSFALEATHWVWEHNTSWIASFPFLVLPLLVCVGVQLREPSSHRPRASSSDPSPPHLPT